MYRLILVVLVAAYGACSCQNHSDRELASKILNDENLIKVDSMARQLMKKGFYAGSGYQMVWARDLNTFIELSCQEYDHSVIRENLLMFFHFQQENGELLDGYVPREAFTWGDPNTYESKTAPGHIGFKNTVETDQETSLIQAIHKYILLTKDESILSEEVAGKTVYERLNLSVEYLLSERYSEEYRLLSGATTFDWGDVQVEGGTIVDVDSLTHWSIDVYDNAMFAIALEHMAGFAGQTEEKERWNKMRTDILSNIRKHLWDGSRGKFIPHVYIDESPFPPDFNENLIHYHGGTAVAIEAGVLKQEEISMVLSHMKRNVELSGAPSIGLTLYPTYPDEVLGESISSSYEYQNGGDWTWFGGRMIQQLIAYGFVEEAYELARPMMERVVANNGFYEWYKIDGTPAGSADFKGSAGVLAKSIEMFYQWASENNTSESKVIWQIGENNNSGAEFALAPNEYSRFIEMDFGWEDKYFLIGTSNEKTDWPYIIPGTSDTWGGTWGTSGWRSSTLNILFGIDKLPKEGTWKLSVDILDCNPKERPLLKVTVNGKSWKYRIPALNPNSTIDEEIIDASEYIIEIALEKELIQAGGNEITLTVLEGSWLKFDQVKLEGPAKVRLRENQSIYLRGVEAADYEIETAYGFAQALLVDVEHLSGIPEVLVKLDGKEIFSARVEAKRYTFEAPMPRVESEVKSKYEIFVDGEKIQSGELIRGPKTPITPTGYVDTKMGTAHSRWMIAPGPWMPFSMVKMSPDNQNDSWQAGYEPTFESIGCFSHIHEWTIAGLGCMPTNGPLKTQVGDEKDVDSGYRSRIDKSTEEAPIGYYKVDLIDYNIQAEMTASTRCAFQRYTFPGDRDGSRVLFDLMIPSEYTYQLQEVYIRKTGDKTLEAYSHQLCPNTWAGGISQEYMVHFVAEFDRAISGFSVWTENGVQADTEMLKIKKPLDAGAIVEFDTRDNKVVQLRTGISYVSIENARKNLETEISEPCGWDFDALRRKNLDAWDELMQRVLITSKDQREKMRFYNNFYRSLCSRNTFSDVNGEWRDADERIRKMDDPDSPALGCDAFWNTFWNLNQFWYLVTPEWSNRWVKSQLAMYDANGWLAKGPAAMEYIPVMVAEHEIPLIVGAYQMGIRDYDVEKAYEAVKKMQTTPGQEVGGGYAGNRDLTSYLKHGYVPYDKGRFSNSLEYSFDDWTVSQFARALGKEKDYQSFLERGYYWRNIIDRETGYARMKDSNGEWISDFDPYKSGANKHYVEGNAWQLTYFVPQDVPALADAIGKDRFIERLDWGFTESDRTRFNGMNDQYWNYPVIQGNQQSMHFAFLFNWVGKPWLTQKWSRAVMDRYYGYGVANAYLGDEDQGQMSAWFIMASLGLFQTDGACRVEPIYEIGSPLFEKVEIYLGGQFGRGESFVIEARNASRLNQYVQSAKLNGKELMDFKFRASEVLKGGRLELQMGSEPNENWGIIKD